MIKGELYDAQDPLLKKLRRDARVVADAFNALPFADEAKGTKMLQNLFAKFGKNSRMKKPVYFDYGINVSLGDNFYANYDTLLLDVAPINIGNNVMFGPRVSIITALHPLDVNKRNSGLESGKPITIEDNVWLGANVVVNPGVTIGENSVIGSGSVVTRDIPANVLAVGNPCRVIRNLNEK